MGHKRVGWVIQGVKWAVNNLICHRLGVLSFLPSGKLLSFWIMWEKACFGF